MPICRKTVVSRLGESGVSHPVTAVLLNFRAYDTLLEVGVILIALLGAEALQPVGRAGGTARLSAGSDPLLAALVRAVVPLMVLVAGYLLWAGSTRPGGAFQGAAVLAGAGVMLRLVSEARPPSLPRTAARMLSASGLVVFLAVGVIVAFLQGHLLQYPREYAGALIVLIETVLTVSIAAMLVALFDRAHDASRRGDV